MTQKTSLRWDIWETLAQSPCPLPWPSELTTGVSNLVIRLPCWGLAAAWSVSCWVWNGGDNLAEFRKILLTGKSGIQKISIRYMGEVLAGLCHLEPLKYQKKKDLRRGTRAGSTAI